ncbi:MAG TPA: hypothetical protein VIK91_11545, partial [Nannocystis sp.]
MIFATPLANFLRSRPIRLARSAHSRKTPEISGLARSLRIHPAVPPPGLIALALCGLLALAPARPAVDESALERAFDSDTAVAVALARSPGLQAADHRIRAAERLADA